VRLDDALRTRPAWCYLDDTDSLPASGEAAAESVFASSIGGASSRGSQVTSGCCSRRISSQARIKPSRASRGRRLIVALCRLLVLFASPLVLGERFPHLLSCPALTAHSGDHPEFIHPFGDLVGLAPSLV
jgi:hypothetical protein